jgi:hypothetical protein
MSQDNTSHGNGGGSAEPTYVEVVVALTWENGNYAARCLVGLC